MIGARAQGKINLVFQVGGVRPDGYHPVRTIYQALDLAEEVFVEPSDAWQVEVEGDVPGLADLELDQSNLVVRSAKALAKFASIENPQPMRFLIRKQIPIAGGMAGGSADAAAALVALNEAWCLGLEASQLVEVASGIGADVPFALLGGTALGTGTGAELESLPSFEESHVLLVFSEKGLSTASVFREFDRLKPNGDDLNLDGSNYQGLIGSNSLQVAALSLMPELREVLDLELGIKGGYLSGSGPTVWFMTDSAEAAKQAQQIVSDLGLRTQLTKTTNLGARLI